MQGRLSIGDFSKMTHLSIRTLRRYHESGLLEPAEIDEWSSYRYYQPEQIPVAQTIRRLRDLDMPIREINELLATADADRRTELLGAHLTRLEEQLEQTRHAVTTLRRLLEPEASLEVIRRRTAPLTVAAITDDVDSGDVLEWYSRAMDELRAVAATPTGPPGGLYDNRLFTDGRGTLTIFLPTRTAPIAGRAQPLTIPATELATTIHRGAHTDIDVTYGRLGRWVSEQDLAIDGPVHEYYLFGPADTDDESQWRTEIGWPVTSER